MRLLTIFTFALTVTFFQIHDVQGKVICSKVKLDGKYEIKVRKKKTVIRVRKLSFIKFTDEEIATNVYSVDTLEGGDGFLSEYNLVGMVMKDTCVLSWYATSAEGPHGHREDFEFSRIVRTSKKGSLYLSGDTASSDEGDLLEFKKID